MSFDDEMKGIKNAETSGSYISKPCVELVTIKGYKMSPENHTGCPFIEFTFETAGKDINNSRLYRVNTGDSPEKAEIKNKKLKELMENASADFTLKGEQVVKSIVGKKVKALFKSKEQIGADKNNMNKPIIWNKIEYSFSAKPDAEIKGNQSYFYTPLSPADQAKYQGELAKWERDNLTLVKTTIATAGAQVTQAMPDVSTPKIDETDDLPF